MALRNGVEALAAAAKEKADRYSDSARENARAYTAMFKENQVVITSALAGRRESFEGPLASLGHIFVRGSAVWSTTLFYPFDRWIVGKPAEEIREECEKRTKVR